MQTRILILAANPKDTSRLRLDEEAREIEYGMRLAKHRDEFLLRHQWATRPQDIRRVMLDFEPNVVHFCGHGEGEEGIVFEDDSADTHLVSAVALSGFFKLFADVVRCVILNACFSEIQAVAIARHIPYVIGMKRAISDRAAIEFAIAFYDALCAGKSLEFAFELACNAIHMAGMPEHAIPRMVRCPGPPHEPLIPDQESTEEVEIPVVASGGQPAKRETVVRGAVLEVANLQEVLSWGWKPYDLLENVVALDYETMAGLTPEFAGEVQQWTDLYVEHPDTWRLIVERSTHRIAGYWHFVPLFESEFTKSKQGNLLDSEIRVENVRCIELPGQYDIYFIGFSIRDAYRGRNSLRLLFSALLDTFLDLARQDIYIRGVCANAYTNSGVALCRSLGMPRLCGHTVHGDIYAIEFPALFAEPIFRAYGELVSVYLRNGTLFGVGRIGTSKRRRKCKTN